MSDTRTPGQRAYEAWAAARADGRLMIGPWHLLESIDKAAWEAAASAVMASQADQAAVAAKIDREEAKRYADEGFQRWLDESVCDGHTVFDLLKNVHDAYSGWSARGSTQEANAPLIEALTALAGLLGQVNGFSSVIGECGFDTERATELLERYGFRNKRSDS